MSKNFESYWPEEEPGFFESDAYIQWWQHSLTSLLSGGPVEDFMGNIILHPTDFEAECEGVEGTGCRAGCAEAMLTMVEERVAHSYWRARDAGWKRSE